MKTNNQNKALRKLDKQLSKAENKLMKAQRAYDKKDAKVVSKITKQSEKAGIKLGIGPAPQRRTLRQDGRWPVPVTPSRKQERQMKRTTKKSSK